MINLMGAIELGLRAPLGAAALRRLDELLAARLGEDNESALIDFARMAPKGSRMPGAE